MKKVIKILLPIVTVFVIFSSFNIKSIKNYDDSDKDKVLITVLNYMLTKGHFSPKEMDDDFSERVFTNFIDGLDPTRRYFTQKDINDFSKYKYSIDNQIKKSELDFYKLVYGRFLEKIKTAKNYYGEILSHPFSYNKKEEIDVDYEKIPFAKNENELIDYWRKQMKLSVLGRIKDNMDLETSKAEKDKKFKKSTFSELEIKAREEVKKNMDELYIRIEELENDDWYSTYLNAIVQEFDPHSTYMPPSIKDKFDIDMSGKLEGIGARLQKKGIYTTIFEVISGGPAWKQGDLEPGDIIMEVAQADAEPLSIVGMRLDDAIKFIKGKKGTEVRLTVKKKVDGSIKIISIIRDVVKLDETFVKSSIVEKDGNKYAIINLPKFYIDFSDENFRDSAKDMEKEIENLKEEGVKGLLIDLRNNGGGSLKTAIEIAGLFIEKGPVVQVKYRGEKPTIKSDADPKIQWTGPLVVMVNELSASASEIFAAAMQDYKRAIIIGGKQTFGKGTVQNILPINKFYKYDSDLGFLKLTIQKFYRVNGGSTQKEGVYSDIALPSKYSYMDFGERDMEGALEWDKVASATYTEVDAYENYSDVIAKSKERILKNKNFQMIDSYAKWLDAEQKNTSFSLNYKQFIKDQKKYKSDAEKYKNIFKFESDLTFVSPKNELPLIAKDSIIEKKRTLWHQNLSKDIYVNEALNVLSELKMKDKFKIAKH